MKKICLLFLFFFCGTPFAVPEASHQEIQGVLDAGTAYDEAGDYKNAIAEYKHALRLLREKYGNQNETIPELAFYIGQLDVVIGEGKDALENYAIAFEAYNELHGPVYEDSAAMLQQMANVYIDFGMFEEALAHLEQSEAILKELYGADSMHYNLARVWEVKCVALYYLGRYDEVLSNIENVERIARSYDDADALAHVYTLKGQAYGAKGDVDRELAFLRTALETRIEIYGEDSLELVTYYANYADALWQKGDYSAAFKCNVKAFMIAVAHVDQGLNSECIHALNAFGVQLEEFGKGGVLEKYLAENDVAESFADFYAVFNSPDVRKGIKSIYPKFTDASSPEDLALVIYHIALFFSKKSYGEDSCAPFYNNIGNAYYRKSEYGDAMENFEKALAVYEKLFGECHPRVAHVYSNIAGTHYASGNQKQAISYWDKAFLAWNGSVEYGEIISRIKDILTLGIHDTGFTQRALNVVMAAFERSRLDMGSLKDKFLVQALPVYYYGIRFSAGQKNPAQAFEYSEAMRNRSFLDQIGTESALRLDGITAEEKQQVQALVGRLETYRKSLGNVSDSNAGEATGIADALSATEMQLEALDAAIAKRVPRYAQLRNPATVSIKEAQAYCGKDRAILEYVIWNPEHYGDSWTGEAPGSYCIVITAKKTNIVALDPGYDYAAAVKKLYDGVSTLKHERVFEDARNELYQKLIMPVSPFIKGKKRLLIVPDGNLALLPFDVLRKDEKAKMLGESYAVSLSPSVSVSMIASHGGEDLKNVFAVGGAWYDKRLSEEEHDQVLTQGKPYQKRGGGWGDLPGSVRELSLLREDVFTGREFVTATQREATEANVKRLSHEGELARYSVVHFACHGYYKKSEDDEPTSLLFSEISGKFAGVSDEDGYLTIPEAAVLNLNAGMVCLSACETGIVESSSADGMVGLARSFMVAGAGHVGVSLWEASDDAAAEFMTGMYTKVLQGAGYVTAYQKMKEGFRKSEDWSHPFYWALYTLYE